MNQDLIVQPHAIIANNNAEEDLKKQRLSYIDEHFKDKNYDKKQIFYYTDEEKIKIHDNMEIGFVNYQLNGKFEHYQGEKLTIAYKSLDKNLDRYQKNNRLIAAIEEDTWKSLFQLFDLIVNDFNQLQKDIPLYYKVLINCIYHDETLKKHLKYENNILSWKGSFVFKDQYSQENNGSLLNQPLSTVKSLKKGVFYGINMILTNYEEFLWEYFFEKCKSIENNPSNPDNQNAKKIIGFFLFNNGNDDRTTSEAINQIQQNRSWYVKHTRDNLKERLIVRNSATLQNINKSFRTATLNLLLDEKNDYKTFNNNIEYLNQVQGGLYHYFNIYYFFLLSYDKENHCYVLHTELLKDNLTSKLLNVLNHRYCALHTHNIFNIKIIEKYINISDLYEIINEFFDENPEESIQEKANEKPKRLKEYQIQENEIENLKILKEYKSIIEEFWNINKCPPQIEAIIHFKKEVMKTFSTLRYENLKTKSKYIGFNMGYSYLTMKNMYYDEINNPIDNVNVNHYSYRESNTTKLCKYVISIPNHVFESIPLTSQKINFDEISYDPSIYDASITYSDLKKNFSQYIYSQQFIVDFYTKSCHNIQSLLDEKEKKLLSSPDNNPDIIKSLMENLKKLMEKAINNPINESVLFYNYFKIQKLKEIVNCLDETHSIYVQYFKKFDINGLISNENDIINDLVYLYMLYFNENLKHFKNIFHKKNMDIDDNLEVFQGFNGENNQLFHHLISSIVDLFFIISQRNTDYHREIIRNITNIIEILTNKKLSLLNFETWDLEQEKIYLEETIKVVQIFHILIDSKPVDYEKFQNIMAQFKMLDYDVNLEIENDLKSRIKFSIDDKNISIPSMI